MNEEEKIIQQIKEEKDIFNKARLINYLVKEKELKIKDLAEKLSLKPSYLCHLLRLNNLPPLVIDGFYNKQISLSHLFVISRLKDQKKIVNLYEKVLANNLTVVQTEEKLREILYQIKNEGNFFPIKEIKILEEKIKNEFPKVKIKLIQTRIKAKLIFELKDSLKNTSYFLKKIINKLTK